ncbi:MAG: anthranilate phosphoribosyltransferase [Anaerolineae bacterium]|nr:anthranilate phosphoribosyltransferase [Anaerolineae bacterium]
MSVQKAIAKLSKHENLTQAEAEAAMDEIMTGNATQAQIGGYLMALRFKGETIEEITGSAISMRRAANHPPVNVVGLVDTCGTGGDGSGTFNISTTVAFVVAGTGIPVAKHGNRAASSKTGSADVLEALGVNLKLTPEQVGECINSIGIGFMFATLFHPAMKHAIGARRELGVRTIFNILGPLTNPAGAKRQLMGVFSHDLVEKLANVLCLMGGEAAFVVHGEGGLDELTTTGANWVSELRDGQVKTYTLAPEELGFQRTSAEELIGGEAAFNAEITRGILDRSIKGGKRDVVLLNAAAAIVAGGKAPDLATGIKAAADSIDSGAALGKLNALVNRSQELAAQAS